MTFRTALSPTPRRCAAWAIAWLAASTSVCAQPTASPDLMARLNLPACTPERLANKQLCGDLFEFDERGTKKVADLWYRRQYQKLDALFEQWCKGADRFVDGHWMLSAFGTAMSSDIRGGGDWEKPLARVREWQALAPGSNAARYVEGVYWQQYAWDARGAGFVNTVTPEGWKLYRQRLDKALEVNSTALGTSSTACPILYGQAINLLLDASAPPDAIRKIYERGVAAHPQYHRLHYAMSRGYTPRWGGSAPAFEKFAQEVVARTKAFEGTAMYARLYQAGSGEPELQFPSKRGTPAWPALRQAYEDLLARYPSSFANLLTYMELSCRSDDSETYRRLRAKLPAGMEFKQSDVSVDVCDRRHKFTPAR